MRIGNPANAREAGHLRSLQRRGTSACQQAILSS